MTREGRHRAASGEAAPRDEGQLSSRAESSTGRMAVQGYVCGPALEWLVGPSPLVLLHGRLLSDRGALNERPRRPSPRPPAPSEEDPDFELLRWQQQSPDRRCTLPLMLATSFVWPAAREEPARDRSV